MDLNIQIIKGDITKMAVDVIVNAANESLLGGGGVDGAIHKAAGPELLEECRNLRGCFTGHAKLTRGYDLPAKYIIHTVGPVWQGGNKQESDMLSFCYRNCFLIIKEKGFKSIAFPSISAGAYHYPIELASRIALKETRDFLRENPNPDLRIIFVCFDDQVYNAYLKAYEEIFEGKKEVKPQEVKNLKSKTILLVEDNESTSGFLARMISRKGWKVLSTVSGKEAIKIYQDNRPDYVFLDAHLPDMEGVSVFRSIRSISGSAMIYFVTGDSAFEFLHEKLGANGYISKPIDMTAMSSLLDELAKA